MHWSQSLRCTDGMVGACPPARRCPAALTRARARAAPGRGARARAGCSERAGALVLLLADGVERVPAGAWLQPCGEAASGGGGAQPVRARASGTPAGQRRHPPDVGVDADHDGSQAAVWDLRRGGEEGRAGGGVGAYRGAPQGGGCKRRHPRSALLALSSVLLQSPGQLFCVAPWHDASLVGM